MEPIEIHFGDTFGQNLIRLAGILNREAIKQLAPPVLEAGNIHESRLCFKRLRSLLRMGRHGLDKGEYARLNTFYRDQARALAGQRDYTVLSETVKPFIKACDSASEKTNMVRFRAHLHHKRKKETGGKNHENARNEVVHNLTKMQAQLLKWRFSDDKTEIFFLGLQTTYKQARKELALLKTGLTDHLLHEWRKHVKYLWYQTELLIPLWPVVFKAWVKELKTLSQLLGRHHDLMLLETALLKFIEKEQEKAHFTTIQKIKSEKEKIEKEAIGLGCKLFALRGGAIYSLLLANLQTD